MAAMIDVIVLAVIAALIVGGGFFVGWLEMFGDGEG
jgi:hypothetical protein